MNFDQITDDIFVGSELGRDDWATLKKLGITANLNLQEEKRDLFDGTAPEVSVWLPTADWFGPNADEIETGARLVASLVDAGHKVYIHCRHGAGRAPIVGAAYLVTTGMDVEDAFNFVRQQRPGFKPNPKQVNQLRKFAKNWLRKQAR